MMRFKTELQKGIAALIFLTFIFAFMNVLSRFLGGGLPLFQQVYLRVLVALIVALIVFWPHIRWAVIAKIPLREWMVLAFRGLVIYGLGVTMIAQASILTQLGTVSFIAALPFVSLLGFFFLKEKVTWWKIAFILSALAGVALLTVQNVGNLFQWGLGDVLALLSTLAFSFGYISRRWHNGVLNNQEISTLTFVFGAAFTVLFSMAFAEGVPAFDSSWLLWAGVLLGGVLNVINMFLVNYGFQHVDAVRGGNILTLEVVWGVMFGLLLYQEVPTIQGLVGGLMIVASVIAMNHFAGRDVAPIPAMQEDQKPIA